MLNVINWGFLRKYLHLQTFYYIFSLIIMVLYIFFSVEKETVSERIFCNSGTVTQIGK